MGIETPTTLRLERYAGGHGLPDVEVRAWKKGSRYAYKIVAVNGHWMDKPQFLGWSYKRAAGVLRLLSAPGSGFACTGF